MIFVGGVNQFTQLYGNSNDHDGSIGIINPPVQLPINPYDIKSYSVYGNYAIAIYNDNNSLFAVGLNTHGEIDERLPKDVISNFTPYSSTLININNKYRKSIPISVVCGYWYILYLLFDTEDPTTSKLGYRCHCMMKACCSQTTEILNTPNIKPIAIYGGEFNAAAIESEGGIVFINIQRLYSYRQSLLETSFLPNGEKAVCVACCTHFFIALSSTGKIYESKIESNVQTKLTFSEVPEFNGIEIVHISGTHEDCLVVTKDGRVFGKGQNNHHQFSADFSPVFDKPRFVEITSLSQYKIVAAYAGSCHSLFQTSDGKILGCGNNYCNQLFLASGRIEKNLVFPPEESIIKSGAVFCIAGRTISAVFTDFVPPNMANRVLDKNVFSNTSLKDPTNKPSSEETGFNGKSAFSH